MYLMNITVNRWNQLIILVNELPEDIRRLIFIIRIQIFANAAKKIQNNWKNYITPKRIATLLAWEQINPYQETTWYYIFDVRLLNYLVYFVKHVNGKQSPEVWIPFLDYLQNDLELQENSILNDNRKILYSEVLDSYKFLRKKFGYNKLVSEAYWKNYNINLIL